MIMEMRTPGALLALALLGAPAGRAQDAPVPPVVPGGVELVRVDVIVTDGKGRHVDDLRPEDFTIEEDGHTRSVAALRYVAGRPSAAAATVAGAPDTEPALPGASEPRSLAIVLDDMTFSAVSRVRVPRVIRRFFDGLAGSDTPVAIMRTGGGVSAIQDFTTDRALLEAVLSHLRPAPGGLDGLQGDNMEAEQRVELTLQMLRSVKTLARELVERPGRKTLIIVSEGMPLSSRADPEGVRGLDELRRVTDAANRAGVVISTIDPSGLTFGGTAYSASSHIDPFTTSEGLRSQLSGPMLQGTAQRQGLRRGSEQLAAETGGLALSDGNDIGGAIERAWSDQDGYYLIGYEPEASSVPAPGAVPLERKVTVRVKRKGLKVRARRVYYARAAEPGPAAP